MAGFLINEAHQELEDISLEMAKHIGVETRKLESVDHMKIELHAGSYENESYGKFYYNNDNYSDVINFECLAQKFLL